MNMKLRLRQKSKDVENKKSVKELSPPLRMNQRAIVQGTLEKAASFGG